MTSDAALLSWTFEPGLLLGLALTATLYLRGWLRLHVQVPARFTTAHLVSFLGGLFCIFIALCSPLDAFARFLLSVHMVQHLLLTMVAPPLLLLGNPFLPTLLGLPRVVRVDALAPFLVWTPLKRLGSFLIHPAFAWSAFIVSNVGWHLPPLYDLALRDQTWHQIEHASFLLTAILFWWPVVQPWPSRPHWPRWAAIPYLLLADLQNTALAGFISFYDKILYPTYAAAPRISGLSALDDQAAAGAIMWVPGSIAFILPAALIAISYLGPRRTSSPRRASRQPLLKLHLRVPTLTTVLVRLRRPVQFLLLALAALIVIDGLTGPPVAALNAAGVLPWTHWRGLSVIALLLLGNLFCYACPFTFLRDLTQKITAFLPFRTPSWSFPKFLRNKWLPAALIVLYLWAYEAFSLWNDPAWTAFLVLGYFGATLTVDGLFRNGTFCKHVCPIGQFHFVQSLASPAEVSVRSPDVCRTCRTHDCIKGNTDQRGCELELFQPRKSGNMDCTFCLDCVSACPHDNVAIQAVPPAADLTLDPPRSSVGKYANRPDLAALVLVLTFGAFANAAGMTAPVQELAATSGLNHLAFTTTFLAVTLLALPAVCLLLPGASRSAHAIALAPLGFGMWLAHFSFHLVTGLFSFVPIFQRLLGFDASTPTVLSWNALPALEILLLDAGYLVTLFVLYRLDPRPRVFIPWAALATGLFLVGLWIIFQPMQMRGMPLAG
ncbi:MAG: cytochrome c oxidase assembly protein [Chthoniobacterales bacterium]